MKTVAALKLIAQGQAVSSKQVTALDWTSPDIKESIQCSKTIQQVVTGTRSRSRPLVIPMSAYSRFG